MRFATFPLHLSKVLRLPGKSDAKSYKVLIVLHLLRKLDDLMLQNATPLRNDLRTALMNMSLVLRVPCEIKLFSSSSNASPLPSFLDMLQNPHVLLPFYEVHNLLRWPLETTPERPKAVRTCGAFNISTWNCASRHNGVHFFDISTSKSAPNLACFVHFDLEMCFVPQRRTLVRHLNFQKFSETQVFCTFSLENLLRATTACNFLSLIWPDGSAPAALASLLFDPPEPQIIGKTQCFATLLPFRAPASSFLWLFLFSDLHFSCLLFSGSSHLFPSVHSIARLTSKLPSTIKPS